MLKKTSIILVALLAVALMASSASAATFKLNVDLKNNVSIASLLQGNTIKQLLIPDSLSLSGTFTDDDVKLTAGITNIFFEEAPKPRLALSVAKSPSETETKFLLGGFQSDVYGDYSSLYVALFSPNFNVWGAVGNSPVNDNAKIDSIFKGYSVEKNVNDFTNETGYYTVYGMDNAFPSYQAYAFSPNYSLALDAKYLNVTLSNYFGIVDYNRAHAQIFNPYLLGVDLDNGYNTYLANKTRVALDVNENIQIGANLTFVNAEDESAKLYNLAELSLDLNGQMNRNTGKYFASIAGQKNEVLEVANKGFALNLGVTDLSLIKGDSLRFSAAYKYVSKGFLRYDDLFRLLLRYDGISDKMVDLYLPYVSDISYSSIDLGISRTFNVLGAALKLSFDNELGYVKRNVVDQEYTFISDLAGFKALLTTPKNNTLKFTVGNSFVHFPEEVNGNLNPALDVDEEDYYIRTANDTIFGIGGSFNITKNITIKASFVDVLSYWNTLDNNTDIDNAFGGNIAAIGKWTVGSTDKVLANFTGAAAFGGSSITAKWYNYDAFLSADMTYKNFSASISAFAGEDEYTRMYSNNFAFAANLSLMYKIVPQAYITGTMTYRNWGIGTDVYYKDNVHYTVEDKLFGAIGIHLRPYKECEINITWGRSGLADERIFNSANSEDIMPWHALSTVPTYGKMGLNFFELGIRIKF